MPPKHRSPPKQLSPLKPTGPALRTLCTGDHQSPRTPKQSWIGDHYHPEGAARCAPIVPLLPIQNSNPLRNEGSSHNECGELTATSSCQQWPVLPSFYPAFTPVLHRSSPFFTSFTLFRFVVLPYFYPAFTFFLLRSTPSFLPPFYPNFTPFVKGKIPNLPHFYPVFTAPPVCTLSTVLPRFYPIPSTLRMPIPIFTLG